MDVALIDKGKKGDILMKSVPPIARTEKLVVQDSVNEVLVYDLETNTAHCLNETATFVWSNCDGKKSVTEIEILVTKKFGNTASKEFVWLALDSLKKSNLLKNSDTIETNFDGLSRRQVIKRIGLSSMIALPLISSLVAPSAANALSGALAANCASCNQNSDCVSNNCQSNPYAGGMLCAVTSSTGGTAPSGYSAPFSFGSMFCLDSGPSVCCSGTAVYNAGPPATCGCL